MPDFKFWKKPKPPTRTPQDLSLLDGDQRSAPKPHQRLPDPRPLHPPARPLAARRRLQDRRRDQGPRRTRQAHHHLAQLKESTHGEHPTHVLRNRPPPTPAPKIKINKIPTGPVSKSKTCGVTMIRELPTSEQPVSRLATLRRRRTQHRRAAGDHPRLRQPRRPRRPARRQRTPLRPGATAVGATRRR